MSGGKIFSLASAALVLISTNALAQGDRDYDEAAIRAEAAAISGGYTEYGTRLIIHRESAGESPYQVTRLAANSAEAAPEDAATPSSLDAPANDEPAILAPPQPSDLAPARVAPRPTRPTRSSTKLAGAAVARPMPRARLLAADTAPAPGTAPLPMAKAPKAELPAAEPQPQPESFDSADYSADASMCDGSTTCCPCPEFWEHGCGVFAEYLYLHATGVDMAHAIQQNGTGGDGTVPAGAVGVADPRFESGFRVGFEHAMSSCTSIVAGYTWYASHATDELAALNGTGDTIASLVLHPGTANAGSTSVRVGAAYDIDFQFADLAFTRLISGNDCYALNYLVGIRYGNLEQNFVQIGPFSPPTGVIQTTTDIDFDGLGLRLGLDGRRRIGCGGWSTYANGGLSLLFGEFETRYLQFNNTTDSQQALSTWNDDRVVPILELEVGVAWTSCNDCWRLSMGYYQGFWFNAITTPEYVQAVQQADFVDLGDTIAFNGLTSRVEFRW